MQHYAPGPTKTEHVRVQEAESVQLLYEFMHDPSQYMQHPMRYTTSVVTSLSYGVRCEAYEDPAVHGIEDIMARVCELLMPGSKPPVEEFPWLGYLPDLMSPWKVESRSIGEAMEKLYGELSEIAWQRGSSGLNTNTLAYKLRLDEDSTGLTRHQQAYVCGLVLEGGSDILRGPS